MDTQGNHQLVIRDSMLIWRIGGLIMAIISGVDVFYAHFFKNYDLIFLIGSLGMVFLSANLTIIADRPTRTLRLEYRYLLFHNAKEIPFDDIESIHVKSSGGRSHSSATYRIIATLKNGKNVPFRSISSGGRNELARQAARLQAFINHKTALRKSKDTEQTAQNAGSDQPNDTDEANEIPASEISESGMNSEQ